MKKIMMIAILLVAAMTANAQNDYRKNEIGVYYGFASASNVVSAIGTAFNWDRNDQTGFWGPVGIEYYRHVNRLVAVGAQFSVAGCDWSKNEKASSTYITVMPSLKLNWLRLRYFGMYSAVSMGVMFHNAKDGSESENSTNFMFQGTPLGLEFGGAFRGFAELGFGEKGVLCAGLRYKF